MSPVLTAAAIMTGLGLFFGVVLALAYRFLRVEEDPRIDAVEGMLPGTNCGACGQPGCRAFAELVCTGELLPGKCTVGTADDVAEIAAFLGVDAGQEDKRVARLHCGGGKSSVGRLAEYAGVRSCRAAALVNQGPIACAWGCFGLGDCDVVCTFDAIRMGPEDLPIVDVDLCTACGDCVDICPRDLFEIAPLAERLIVQCASPLTGDAAMAACRVACDACGRCALDADADVIEMVDGLPVIRIPELATERATWRCPTGAIRWVEGEQFVTQTIPEPLRSLRA